MNIDIIVIVIYFILVFYLGIKFAKNSKKDEDFYLAKKEIHWFFLMLSLVATETSSLTFLSIPAMSMKSDYRFLEIGFGYILGRSIVAYFLMPHYFSGNTISIYEYLGNKFGVVTQRTVSFVFTISRLLGDGIRLYVSALPIAFLLQKMGLSYPPEILGILSLSILSLITIIYSVLGGFRAIVFTDVLQWFIYIIGGFFALFLILQLLTNDGKSFLSYVETLSHEGKLNIFQWNWNPESDNSYFVLLAVLGGCFISVGSHGTDLMLVQRVVATKNVINAQKILIGSGIVVFFQFLLFLSIGSCLYLFFLGQNITPDKAFSQFIINYVPTPILGILVSAILASAMSTLSSTINSLSLTWARDWNLERFFSPQFLSLGFGVLLFFSSLVPFFLAEKWEKGILEIGLTIFSYTLGPTIFVFFLAQKNKNIQSSGLLFSVLFLVSILLTVACGTIWKIPFTLLIPIGFFLLGFLLLLAENFRFSKKY